MRLDLSLFCWERKAELLLSLFDKVDSVLYSGDAFGLVIGNRNTKLFLKLHDELYGVEAVCAEQFQT